MSDIGIETSTKIISNLRERMKKEKIEDQEQVKEALREEIEKIMEISVQQQKTIRVIQALM